MTDVGDFLARLSSLLSGAGIPFMLTGSFASTYHGKPRTTQDLDLVIELSDASLHTLLDTLDSDDYYVSEEAAGFTSRSENLCSTSVLRGC
jgi:hypothetical protein